MCCIPHIHLRFILAVQEVGGRNCVGGSERGSRFEMQHLGAPTPTFARMLGQQRNKLAGEVVLANVRGNYDVNKDTSLLDIA